MNDERLYEMVGEELQSKFLRPGLWTKAYADANGDEKRARALYIKYRVRELASEEEQARQRNAVESAEQLARERREADRMRKEQSQREAEEEGRRIEAQLSEDWSAAWTKILAERQREGSHTPTKQPWWKIWSARP
jgi:hypothetical protein